MKPRYIIRDNLGNYYESKEIKNNKFAKWVWNHNKICKILYYFGIRPVRWTDNSNNIYWFNFE